MDGVWVARRPAPQTPGCSFGVSKSRGPRLQAPGRPTPGPPQLSLGRPAPPPGRESLTGASSSAGPSWQGPRVGQALRVARELPHGLKAASRGAIHPLQRQANQGLRGTGEAQGHPSAGSRAAPGARSPRWKLLKQTSQNPGNEGNEVHSTQHSSRAESGSAHRQPPGAAPDGGCSFSSHGYANEE